MQFEFDNVGPRQKAKAPRAIELFAGAGGFSLGMEMAGFEVCAAVEIDKEAARTLEINQPRYHKGMRVICRDVKTLTGKKLMEMAGLEGTDLDLLFGGPPCQGFTTVNTRRSIDDPRSKLMHEMIRIIGEIKPRVFLIENVPGLLSFKDFFILLLTELENRGYTVRFTLLDACGYGVPQRRRRVFIQGVRSELKYLPSWPSYTHFDPEHLKSKKGAVPASTVSQWLFPENGFSKEQVRNVKWNETLGYLFDKTTPPEEVDARINAGIFSAIAGSIT